MNISDLKTVSGEHLNVYKIENDGKIIRIFCDKKEKQLPCVKITELPEGWGIKELRSKNNKPLLFGYAFYKTDPESIKRNQERKLLKQERRAKRKIRRINKKNKIKEKKINLKIRKVNKRARAIEKKLNREKKLMERLNKKKSAI